MPRSYRSNLKFGTYGKYGTCETYFVLSLNKIYLKYKREYVNGQTYNPNCIHQILLIGRFQGISRPHFCATRLSTSSHCLLNIFASDQPR